MAIAEVVKYVGAITIFGVAKLDHLAQLALFERGAPGMHTTDTIDYGVVVRGEMTLELDDGKIVHLRQGDCIVQNGTRHRWRNSLPEPCLMAFVSVGGKLWIENPLSAVPSWPCSASACSRRS